MEKLLGTIEECHKIIRLLQSVVSDLSKQVEMLSKRVGELLEQGSYTAPELNALRMCKNLLKSFYARF